MLRVFQDTNDQDGSSQPLASSSVSSTWNSQGGSRKSSQPQEDNETLDTQGSSSIPPASMRSSPLSSQTRSRDSSEPEDVGMGQTHRARSGNRETVVKGRTRGRSMSTGRSSEEDGPVSKKRRDGPRDSKKVMKGKEVSELMQSAAGSSTRPSTGRRQVVDQVGNMGLKVIRPPPGGVAKKGVAKKGSDSLQRRR